MARRLLRAKDGAYKALLQDQLEARDRTRRVPDERMNETWLLTMKRSREAHGGLNQAK
jgi:hypothetical protein